MKKILTGLVLLLALIGIALEVLSRLYQEKAGAFFREKFTAQSDLVLQPFKTTVSVWSHFPRVTFNLKNLALVDTSGLKPVTVLSIKKAEIAVPLGQFNLDQLQISRVDLTDVLFYQHIDKAGNKTGLRFKKFENPDTTGTGLPLIIPKLRIRNARLSAENHFKESSFSILIREADLKASLADKILEINGKLIGRIDSVKSKKLILFRNEPFTSNAQYRYNLPRKKGTLDGTSLNLNNHQISIDGGHTALPYGGGNVLNLKIAGNQPLLYLLTQLLPAQAKTFLSEVRTESKMQFALHITGKSGPMTRPRNLIKFALRNGDIYLPKTKTSIREVSLVGEMDNGTLQLPETSRLTISDFSAHTREDSFRVNLEVYNFLRPVFQFNSLGRMRLAKLAAFVKLPVTRIMGGDVVGEVHLSGSLPDSLHPQTPDWKGNGSLVLHKAAFRPTGLTVDCRGVNGGISFRNEVLAVKGLHGTLGGHPFRLQASVKNFLAYLFDQPGAINATANIFAATLNSDWLDKEVLKKSEKTPVKVKKKSTSGNVPSYRQATLRGITSQVDLRVNKVVLPLGKKLANLVVQVNQKNEIVKLTRMRFTSAGGGLATADGGFALNASGLHDPYLNVQLYYPELDLQKFLGNITALKGQTSTASAPAGKKSEKQAVKKSGKPGKGKFLKEEDYRLNLLVKAGRINYLHLNGTDLILKASLNSREVKIGQLDFASSGGHIHVRGTMKLDAPGQRYPVKLRAELHRLNLQQLFAMAENMKLDVLGSQNIRGTVECNLTILTELDQKFIPDLNQTTAYARATLLNLELIEVTPIQNALKMLKNERTRHLYFEDMTTNFILNDKQFLTPGLRMNSNLTAFNLSGTYTMGGGAHLNMDVGVMSILVGNNKRRIEKIQAGDSSLAPNFKNKQHLLITRENQKYKVNLSNRKQREERALALKQEFRHLIRKHDIDTVFTMGK